jgi:hypothetical protein
MKMPVTAASCERNEVIDCVAVPIEPAKATPRRRSTSSTHWIWFLVVVLAMFKLAAALLVALWALRNYPKLILGGLATLGGLVGLAGWRRSRQRGSDQECLRTRGRAT